MTRGQRAAQIWPILTLCATRRQTLTYEQLGALIGVPRYGLGQLLEPIQSLCILRGLQPLSALVVSDITGTPAEGFIAAENLPVSQALVFSAAWLEIAPPDPEALEAAAVELPSNGRSLEELRAKIASREGR